MDLLRETVAFTCPDGFAMPAYVARPARDEAVPGVLFVVDAVGLYADEKRLADEIASAGYAVMIPDLFARGNWFACIRRLFADLSAEGGRGTRDLVAARGWLARQPFADAERQAVMGLCMGGGFALVLAKTGLFRAAADFYGRPPASLEGTCPIVASFGGRDASMAREIPKLRAQLAAHAIPNDVAVYPTAGHGFMTEPDLHPLLRTIARHSPLHAGADPAAASDAMRRLLAFLATHVGA